MNYIVTGYHFGHAIENVDGKWRYSDTKEEIPENEFSKRKCPKCEKNIMADGSDPCISNLPGVIAACCGHGVEKCYILFSDGICIRFTDFEVEQRNFSVKQEA